ncbi:DUF1735 domain-containing protein [uncultured Proteiniphilum sp.]|jgi:hypothetical protein|uniref:DUF1735 domain-containing protein n=1 Tax=uncultured Proteiniphilum sp. TaxID=497637 RepID=UPI0026093956|nr:DUF1735 domain-containing protein [uncultured Proteiniphilum sp.]
MIKIRSLKINSLIIAFLVLFACERYEEYRYDYEYSAVYFGSQKPLRTLVTRENQSTLDFKLGVVLAGMLENKTDQWATFEIDPSLLQTVEGASSFSLLPEDWYDFDITDNKITIPKGKFLGDFTIKIDKAKFTADPLSLGRTYALPVRILESSADSILAGDNITPGKDYTVLVVKYISGYSGTYYVRGEQIELNAQGNEIEGSKTIYSHPDWSRNKTRTFTTLSPSECEITGIGAEDSEKMKIIFGTDHAITLSSSSLNITDLGSSYDTEREEYHLRYSYIKSGKVFQVDEHLKQRNDPENELRFEEWN